MASSSEAVLEKPGFIIRIEAAVMNIDLVILVITVQMFTDPPGHRKLAGTR